METELKSLLSVKESFEDHLKDLKEQYSQDHDNDLELYARIDTMKWVLERIEKAPTEHSLIKRAYFESFGQPIPTFNQKIDTLNYIEKSWQKWFNGIKER